LRPLPDTIRQMIHTENKFATGYGRFPVSNVIVSARGARVEEVALVAE
jgi:hypothetical protein